MRIPSKDLSRISIECGVCGAEMTVDIIRDEHKVAIVRASQQGRPMQCSVCRAPLNLQDGLNSLLDWYDKANKAGYTVFFRLRTNK